ncbi:MAG: bifunctional ornithine acetyltransferase/N-acetylglutamate synthase, partial [Thiogranum sp.]|nr:bifunctional ornithine acetyltransferase/N-acetylglutamate synthase [Thiogranum sp.]
MPIGYSRLPDLLPVAGMRLAAVAAGIRYQDRDDLVVVEIAAGADTAAVFTRNAFCAAPVSVAREHLTDAMPRYLVINSGNANAGTGPGGLEDARQSCLALARLGGCEAHEVLPFSTGVIGQRLAVDRLQAALPAALAALSADGWTAAANAIKTTDTVAKGVSTTLEIENRNITITGICKGAGMIRPDMATMLAYIGTDAGVDATALQQCLHAAVERSFNRITVDG